MSIKATTTIELIRVDDGDNGIIVSSTAPSNPITGQLWQSETGQPIKRWDGIKWVIHYISADNLNVDTLSAITANIGVLKGAFTKDVTLPSTIGIIGSGETVSATGEVTIDNGIFSGVYAWTDAQNHKQQGSYSFDPDGVKGVAYGSSQYRFEYGSDGIIMQNGTVYFHINPEQLWILSKLRKSSGGSVIKNMATANTMLSLLSYTEVNTLLGTIYTKAEMSDYVYVQAMNGDVYANSAKVIATCYNPSSGYFNVYFDKSTSGSIRITYNVDVIKNK